MPIEEDMMSAAAAMTMISSWFIVVISFGTAFSCIHHD